MRKPDFFIVGQTRSGTSTLVYQLNQHPDIFCIHSGKGDIPQFFGFSPTIKTEEEYLKIFKDVKNEKMMGEKGTDNLMAPKVAQKIHQYYPDAKIIMQLRNPIDMMISLHNLTVNAGVFEPIINFEDALNAEKQREKEEFENPGTYNPNLFYRRNARYVDQVKRYVDLFGLEKIHVRLFDDFLKDSTGSYQEICRFLEVDDTIVPITEHQNIRRISRSRKLQGWVTSMEGTKFRKIVRKIPKIQDVYNIVNRPLAPKERKISKELEQKLKKDLKPEIEALSKLIKKDVTFWCK
jgi:hypothetical protein